MRSRSWTRPARRQAADHKAKQDELVAIFGKLKGELRKYEGRLTPRMDLATRYELLSEKEVEIAGRKREEVYSASLIVQSSYVGFYYMPIYARPDLR